MPLLRRLIPLGCVLALAAAPAALAQDPRAADAPLQLVDSSFQAAPVQLVSTAPVVDEPAVPPGVSMPQSESAMLMALIAGLGGLVLGAMAGVLCCLVLFAMFYY